MNIIRGFSVFLLGLAMIAGLLIVFGSWYTIDQTQRGVILRNGAMSGIAEPGLGFKMPLVDSVRKFSLQTKRVSYTKFEAYSFDQQASTLSISVNYHIDPSRVKDVYTTYGSEEGLEERALGPQVYSQVKAVFGRYTALRSIQERTKLTTDSEGALRDAVKDMPLLIDSVQIENIDFSENYEKSIEQKMLAEVEVQKAQQLLAREKVQADIAATQAKGKAGAYVAAARAEADAIRMKGERYPE
jgi:Membrane protease subunits, stomatin/prohibitin homologs